MDNDVTIGSSTSPAQVTIGQFGRIALPIAGRPSQRPSRERNEDEPMNPMYPAPSFALTFYSMLTLLFGLATLAGLAYLAYKIIPSKAVRRLWSGLDIHAARTGYTRGMRDAEVHAEHQEVLDRLRVSVTEIATQLNGLRQRIADIAIPVQPDSESPQKTEGMSRRPRPSRAHRRLVPDLSRIPFASMRRLGLARPAPLG
ncbi:hypothetical protein M8C13_32385 [Crossiella sp. SN42]|uniref:hypothetical protein n=1 Tax=Crossiella sp. SN42 TaxID=2944808 RepID=UPI00207D1F4A|nr:hypothetical protein [Crossiella sp. SN42]MCO1580462.1 hypothetical protein [Crossiella sp. SN42]